MNTSNQRPLLEILTTEATDVFYDEEAAITALRSLRASVRLDLHGVLSTLAPTRDLGSSVCAISFVGASSPTRTQARDELRQRIALGQIEFGILVFRRKIHKPIFTDAGSKAWVNWHLPGNDAVFIDDGADHIRSVASMCPHIRCMLHDPDVPDNIMRVIQKELLIGSESC